MPQKSKHSSALTPALSVMFTITAFVLVPAVQAVRAQTYTVIYNFQEGADGQTPNGELIQDASGNFYGTASFGGASGRGTVFSLTPAGLETTLHSFSGGQNDGDEPVAGLFLDPAGNLYGTTAHGGIGSCSDGCGTIFKLNTANKITLLHRFTGGSDGGVPAARLVSVNGGLYGSALSGGTANLGVVFKTSKTGAFETLYQFLGTTDGADPQDIVRDSTGNLYGASADSVYEVDQNGQFSLLHFFPGDGSDVANGISPVGRITRDVNGNIHGTTEFGGSTKCKPLSNIDPPGCGVVYRLDTAGNETILHSFFSGMGGGFPQAGLLDVQGVLYGTTELGGDPACDCGVLFQIGKTGHYTVLHRFTGTPDGAQPSGELTLGEDGSIYGTTFSGGETGFGAIFKYTP
jgi:uncharacterized repeat protein (TIGR03803 family)